MSKNNNTQKIVGLGLFTAIVIVLQLMGSFIRFGTFSISLVLVPVVIGAALYGAGAGAWLGFVFGVVVLLSGDAAAFLGVNALGTILTVLVKGTLAGLLSGGQYRRVPDRLPALLYGDHRRLGGCDGFWRECRPVYDRWPCRRELYLRAPLQRGAEPCGRASHPHRQEGSLIHKKEKRR